MERTRARVVALAVAAALARGAAAEDAPAAAEGWTDADVLGSVPLSAVVPAIRLQGTASAEERLRAVDDGLAWLAAHQAPDGAFRGDQHQWCDGKEVAEPPTGAGKSGYETGITGLALSAFAAGGHDHLSGGPYEAAIRRAVAWLLSVQDAEGCLGPRLTQHYVYSHGYGARGLLEIYLLSGDPTLRLPVQRALDFVYLMSNSGGGWRYGIRPGEVDTSVTGLHLVTLLTAWRANQDAVDAGLREPFRLPAGLSPDGSVGKGLAQIEARTDETGRTGYMSRGSGPARTPDMLERFPAELSEAMTAVALASWSMCPEAMREEPALAQTIARSTALVAARPPRWDAPAIDLYYWTYATLALARLGGPAWKAWDAALVGALLPNQRKDGTRCAAKGSWEPVDPWGGDGGRMYMTALAVISLAAPGREPDGAAVGSGTARALARPDETLPRRRRLLRSVGVQGLRGVESAVLPHADAAAPVASRAEAARALGGPATSKAGVAAIGRLLADADASVRTGALASLASLPPAHQATLAPAALAAVGDADPGVRRAALRAVGTLAPRPPGWPDALRARLADADLSVRAVAAGLAVRETPPVAGGAAAFAEVVRTSTGPSGVDALRAAEGLAAAEPDVRAALVERLGDAEPEVRTRAAALLHASGSAGAEASRGVAILVGALADPSYEVREVALRALLARPDGVAALGSALAPLAGDGPRALRAPALRAFAKVAPREALAALHVATSDADPVVAKAAREALATIGIPVPEQAEALARLLGSESDAEAAAGRRALAALGAGAVEALRSRLSDAFGTPALRRTCLAVAAEIGPPARPLEATLVALFLKEKDPGDAMAIGEALARVGARDARAVPRLVEWTRHGDPAISTRAVATLADLAQTVPAAEEPLLSVARANARPVDVRVAALRGLGRLTKVRKETVQDLVPLLGEQEDWYVTNAARGVFGAAGKTGLSVLSAELSKDDRNHRIRMLWTVEHLGPKARPLRSAVTRLASSGDADLAKAASAALRAIDR